MASNDFKQQTEAEIQARILLKHGAVPGLRLFRNTVGFGYQGDVVWERGGQVLLQNARPVTFGLAPGSADLIGWHDGRFVALEVKTPTGRPSDMQTRFIDAVLHHGGQAGVVRSPDDAARVLGLL